MIPEKDNVYHLWLTPENDAHNRFADVIQKLSSTYQTRLFEPHITLAGGITGPEDELIARTKELSRRLTRIPIESQEVKYLNEFYRSLFILVTPGEELINFNKMARKLFGLPLDEEYMPHLSLLYGDLPVKEKQKIKRNLNSTLLAPFHVNNIVLFCTDIASDEWRPVQSFPLATKV